MTAHILVIEDDPEQLRLMVQILEGQGLRVSQAVSAEDALRQHSRMHIDMLLTDWKLPNKDGLWLTRQIRQDNSTIGMAIVTAHGSMHHAAEAIEAGADDYLSKPINRQALLLCVTKVLERVRLRDQNQHLSQALQEQNQLGDIIGKAPVMQALFSRLQRVSQTQVTVLIRGESGTGKELAARFLHHNSKRTGRFIPVNCGAIVESLAESELFGSKKGAFTGATSDQRGKILAADQGTLFLDEVGELSLSLQTKLLRFLQEGTVVPVGGHQEISPDVRVVAATHQDLEAMVAEGKFREDLYYRLAVLPVTMPALRERKADVAMLIEYFLNKFSRQYQQPPPELGAASLRALMDFDWPGNVRQLSNVIERFVLLKDEQELRASLVREGSSRLVTLPPEGLNFDEVERDLIHQAMLRSNNNRTQAARLLGMTYKTFVYRLEKHKPEE